jgi:protein-tyrosine phosphatase
MRPANITGGEVLLQADGNSSAALKAPTESVPELTVRTSSDLVATGAGLQTTTQLVRKRAEILVKWLLPPTALAGLRVVAELRSVSNSRYKRLGSVVRAWRRGGKRPVLRPRVRRVVFVCHGNIMRSPVAEAMLKRELEKQGAKGLGVISAGLHAIDGRTADPRALSVAPEFGVSLVQHRAQLLTLSLVDSSDLIVVMDMGNAAEFLLRYPHSSEKLFLLRQFSAHNRGNDRDIPDPYPGDEEDMRRCCGMLRECVEGLGAELLAGQTKPASS